MTTAVAPSRHRDRQSPTNGSTLTRVGLLGLGTVGAAVARLIAESDTTRHLSLVAALVRQTGAERPVPRALPLVTSGGAVFDARPHVVIEALGGVEPARSLVVESLERGIPVVTANKTLLAVRGDEIFTAAAVSGTPLRYEAAVMAGVPFLGTFARRPLAASVTALTGIVNGTSHFVLTAAATERRTLQEALAEAQRHGYAEPDPAKDVEGVDAAEKLALLLRQFGRFSVQPDAIETTGLSVLTAADLEGAAIFGGAIKPVVHAEWRDGCLAAFSGPAFLTAPHPLASLSGVQNGILLAGAPCGPLFFSGPGAGPLATATSVIDDVLEVSAGEQRPHAVGCTAPGRRDLSSGWLVRLSAAGWQPDPVELSDALAAHDIWVRRASESRRLPCGETRWLLTYPVPRERLDAALAPICAAARLDARALRVLEA